MDREAIKNLVFGFGVEIFYELEETYNASLVLSGLFNNVDSKKDVTETLFRFQVGISLGYNFKRFIKESIVNYRTRKLFTLKRIGS